MNDTGLFDVLQRCVEAAQSAYKAQVEKPGTDVRDDVLSIQIALETALKLMYAEQEGDKKKWWDKF